MASRFRHACVVSALVSALDRLSRQAERRGTAHRERRRHDRHAGRDPVRAGLGPHLRRQGEEPDARVAAGGRGDRRGGSGSDGPARPGGRLVRAARGAGQAGHVLQQSLPADADRSRGLLRSDHRRRPPQPAAVHAAAGIDVAHGAEDDRERPAVHRHRHDAHDHDDADDDVALPGARSAAGGRRRQGVPQPAHARWLAQHDAAVLAHLPAARRSERDAGGGEPDPARRDAGPGQPELHALRRAGRVHLQRAAAG